MLEEIKNTYIKYANHISNWKTMDKNVLANMYLEYENKEPERSYYFSALMCRYWKNVYKFYKTSKSTRLEITDFTSWLAESFFVAFKYRRWKDPRNKLFNDPQAPDKVINRCIFSTRMRYYQYYNMSKRKLNFITDSIERQIELFGQMADVYTKLSTTDVYEDDNKCGEIVDHYIKSDMMFNAVILDLICFGDTFRDVKTITRTSIEKEYEDLIDDDFDESEQLKIEDEDLADLDTTELIEMKDEMEDEKAEKTVSYHHEFSLRKLMNEIRTLDAKYIQYFCKQYSAKSSDVLQAIIKMKELDDKKQLSRVVNRVISIMSKDKKIGEILCS